MPQVSIPARTGQHRMALRFIFAAAGVYCAAGIIAALLIRYLDPPAAAREVEVPTVFWMTTALLAAGSAALFRAAWYVSREKQQQFRRCLVAALVAGTLFAGLQTYGLRCLVRNQDPGQVQTGANAFLTVLASLHAMHFTLALLFLVWVTLNAYADRYDHEYSWGVTVCAWFWHALGVVWFAILGVFLIAS